MSRWSTSEVSFSIVISLTFPSLTHAHASKQLPLKREVSSIIRLPNLSFGLGVGTSFYSSTSNLPICSVPLFVIFFLKRVENSKYHTPIHLLLLFLRLKDRTVRLNF